jgi:hypothetical protein
MASSTPVAPPTKHKGFVKRELNGATFLTLEHVAHMLLVVVVPAVVLTGIVAALSLWFGTPGMTMALIDGPASLLSGASLKAVEGAMSLGLVAALIILVPLLIILDRRTRAEWHKRPGFAGRLAYKVPVYTALAALGTLVVACKIQMLYVILSSLAFIGVPGAPISSMYVDNFIPALLGVLVFGGAGWYVFALAKGRDNGRLFSLLVGEAGAIVVVALFITTIAVLHDSNSFNPPKVDPLPPTYIEDDAYRDLLDKYSQ